MKEIAEQMDSVTFIGTAHIEIHKAWMEAMAVCHYEDIPNIGSLGSLDYALSLKLTKTFIRILAENPEFDMSRVKVYDWSKDNHNLAVFATVDGHIHDRDMDLPKVATRNVLDNMFIYYAGKVAIAKGICYYLENGDISDPDYFTVRPWGEGTRFGELYLPVNNNIYTVEEFLELDKVK